MAITTVTIPNVGGGNTRVTSGDLVGDSTRTVTVQAYPLPGYKFDGWQITIDDTNAGGGGGGTGGGGGSDPSDFAI